MAAAGEERPQCKKMMITKSNRLLYHYGCEGGVDALSRRPATSMHACVPLS